MNTNWEAVLCIAFLLLCVLLLLPLPHWSQVDFLGQFLLDLLVTKLVIIGQEVKVNMLVVRVVYVEVLLSLVGEYRVEFEKVLTSGRDRTERPS